MKSEQRQSFRAIEANALIELSEVPISPDLMRRDEPLKVSRAEKKGRYGKRDAVTKKYREGVEDGPMARFISRLKKKRYAEHLHFSHPLVQGLWSQGLKPDKTTNFEVTASYIGFSVWTLIFGHLHEILWIMHR